MNSGFIVVIVVCGLALIFSCLWIYRGWLKELERKERVATRKKKAKRKEARNGSARDAGTTSKKHTGHSDHARKKGGSSSNDMRSDNNKQDRHGEHRGRNHLKDDKLRRHRVHRSTRSKRGAEETPNTFDVDLEAGLFQTHHHFHHHDPNLSEIWSEADLTPAHYYQRRISDAAAVAATTADDRGKNKCIAAVPQIDSPPHQRKGILRDAGVGAGSAYTDDGSKKKQPGRVDWAPDAGSDVSAATTATTTEDWSDVTGTDITQVTSVTENSDLGGNASETTVTTTDLGGSAVSTDLDSAVSTYTNPSEVSTDFDSALSTQVVNPSTVSSNLTADTADSSATTMTDMTSETETATSLTADSAATDLSATTADTDASSLATVLDTGAVGLDTTAAGGDRGFSGAAKKGLGSGDGGWDAVGKFAKKGKGKKTGVEEVAW